MNLPHFNFFVVCLDMVKSTDTINIVGVADTIIIGDLAELKGVRRHLAFGVSIPDLMSNYAIDFRMRTPDKREYHLDRLMIGRLGNEFVSKDKMLLNFDFDQFGVYIFKAFYEDKFVGQSIFRVISEDELGLLSADLVG